MISKNMRSRMEKVLTSFIVTSIFVSTLRKLYQLLASLKIRNNRSPLNAVRADLSALVSIVLLRISSMIEKTTMDASKMLKVSRAYCLKPNPTSLITISKQKTVVKISFNYDVANSVFRSIGYLSRPRTITFRIMSTVMKN